MEAFIAAAEAAAELAGAVIRPLFRSPLLVEAKGDASPVTEADRGAERAIRALLAERFPAHGIWGEEYGPDRADAEYLWVLDPIDGTRAFVTGRPLFGTLIALLHRGRPVLGLIDQPGIGERWIGVAGQPTRFRSPLGGTPRCRPCGRLAEAELSCTSPEMFEPQDRPGFERLRAAARRVTWGGDCYAYGLMALGLVDVIAESTMKPWDWAALVPVVEGAGGRVTGWKGEALTLESDGRVLAVGDPALLPEATRLLAG
ncbi:inositol monophosphatase family protein [Siccirubricoccus sp. KC 17139]|uniref:Inositol monophosphatase family protein n=1 Tax=Siccirubricoccus soli TaxID=2899147 RepID=A0ABT1D917_9PROT|nr:inositol monophosphatase family protein [Siccirubricoccus soli]MCO6418432.1 inositol monophosphatase family protein [Siccirubricoccus soli]MCP2684567.1 inositol monophosphatase family protein [Siccirubricoccus soli]